MYLDVLECTFFVQYIFFNCVTNTSVEQYTMIDKKVFVTIATRVQIVQMHSKSTKYINKISKIHAVRIHCM